MIRKYCIIAGMTLLFIGEARAQQVEVPKINSYGVVVGASLQVSKQNTYGVVVGASPRVSKSVAYAVVQTPSAAVGNVFSQPFTHP